MNLFIMKYLTTEDNYQSPPLTPTRLARTFPSLVFYFRLARLIWWSAREAKKGDLTTEKRVLGSRGILRSLEYVGVNFQIENLAAFRELKSPCVFVSNHMSTMETMLFTCIIEPDREITYVIKESLIKYPVFKHIMRSRDPIVVTRENPREDFRTVLKAGRERLSRNISVVVFPQTTRSTIFNPSEFNTIGVKLASHAKAPVIPVAIRTDAWGNSKRFIKEFGPIDPSKTVRICFGDPIQIQDNGKEEHEQIVRFILGKLRKWF